MKHFRSTLLILLIAGFTTACIKTYQPTFKVADSNNYVVSGLVTNKEGYQYINVSKTSLLSKPARIPVSNCSVDIIDNELNVFHGEESEAGKYRVWINKENLKTGKSYKLDITTPEGKHLASDYEEMLAAGEIDSIYYKMEDSPDKDSSLFRPVQGIRFYIDMHGEAGSSPYYKYDLTETWEYHVEQPIIWYFDGQIHHVVPPDYSRMICWRTKDIGNIYIFSAENLSQNKYTNGSLLYVDNQSQRLKYLYSLFVTQSSLSKRAYTYWKELQSNSRQNGGLYSKQPIDIEGNLYDLSDPNQSVLGYFSVSAINTERLFVQNVKNLKIDAPCCDTTSLRFGLRDLTPLDYPAYLTGNEYSYSGGLLGEACVNCVRMGGTTVKPDFWPY